MRQLQLQTLFTRRNKLCTKFAKKSLKHSKFSKWFKPKTKITVTRLKPTRFCEVYTRTERFQKSPISFLTDILNKKMAELTKYTLTLTATVYCWKCSNGGSFRGLKCSYRGGSRTLKYSYCGIFRTLNCSNSGGLRVLKGSSRAFNL